MQSVWCVVMLTSTQLPIVGVVMLRRTFNSLVFLPLLLLQGIGRLTSQQSPSPSAQTAACTGMQTGTRHLHGNGIVVRCVGIHVCQGTVHVHVDACNSRGKSLQVVLAGGQVIDHHGRHAAACVLPHHCMHGSLHGQFKSLSITVEIEPALAEVVFVDDPLQQQPAS